MDKLIKKEVDSMNEESCQPPDVKPVVKAEESHATHSFQWCWEKKTKNQPCNEAGTIENSLRKSKLFRELAHKNTDKELVLQMDGKAISSHFPCSLIKNEHLTVNYIKAVDQMTHICENSGSDPQRQGQSAELVTFHVQTKGGAGVVKIMRNSAFEALFQEITVYAYKGEEVKQALKRDGRLQDRVFGMNCALFDKSTDVTTEMSDLVDDLDDKTFKIKRLKKAFLPESQPGSLVNAMERESQRSDKDPPQQSTTTVAVNDNTSEELGSNMEPGQLSCEIPNSQKLRRDLSSQFRDLVKKMKTQSGSQRTSIQDLFRLDYGKNDQTCREVKTMKKLMDLSNSVCQVRINGRPEGSGFLLFDEFVLTNGHVLKNTYNEGTGQLHHRVTVHFFYESLEEMEGGQESGAEVEKVAGFERGRDVSGHEYDWALLELTDHQNLPDPLIKHFGFLPESGGICIIGHPYGKVKMIDPCFIVPTNDRNQVVERHQREYPEESVEYIDENQRTIQIITEKFFEDVSKGVEQKRQALTYETCFYFGSSGSPVFDEHCNVVAMHSGGYVYRHAKKDCSVIEFGHPLSTIIEQIIVHIVERGRFDVLKKYLAFDFACQQDIINNVKKLVESRNLTAFKIAANNPEVTSDKSLKAFFDFLFQKEEPVPMDTN